MNWFFRLHKRRIYGELQLLNNAGFRILIKSWVLPFAPFLSGLKIKTRHYKLYWTKPTYLYSFNKKTCWFHCISLLLCAVLAFKVQVAMRSGMQSCSQFELYHVSSRLLLQCILLTQFRGSPNNNEVKHCQQNFCNSHPAQQWQTGLMGNLFMP